LSILLIFCRRRWC